MKTKVLEELVRNGITPIIKVIDDSNFEGPDNGMIGRITGVTGEDQWGDGESTISFIIDFKEFHDYNVNVAKPNWFDENSNPTLTWMQTKHYETESSKFEMFEMYKSKGQDAELASITLQADDDGFISEYLELKTKQPYTKWLEDELKEARTQLKEYKERLEIQLLAKNNAK